jgi:hypothetical protein
MSESLDIVSYLTVPQQISENVKVICWRLDGPPSQSGHCGEEKNLFPLPEIKP